MKDKREDVTQLLEEARAGDAVARERLHEVLYSELHARAQRAFRKQRPDHTLQPTALVHEVFLRLADGARAQWHDREHFLAVASRAMRQVLVDHARATNRLKRKAAGVAEPLECVVVAYEDRSSDLVVLNDALERLAQFDPEMARAVELRFFGGASVEEAASALGLAQRTFERRWQAARAWLYAEMSQDQPS